MIRCSILPQARPALLLIMLSMAAVPMAYAQDAGAQDAAQDAAMQERLDRIERDLSMLQRQVYRDGGDAAPAGAAAGNVAVNLQVRMDRLEQQMRDLTGRVEDMTNEVEPAAPAPRTGEQRHRRAARSRPGAAGTGTGLRGSPAAPARGRGRAAAGNQRRGSHAVWPPGSVRRRAAARPVGQLWHPDPAWHALRTFVRRWPGPAPDRPYPGPTQLTPRSASAGSSGASRPPGSETLPSGSASAQYNAAFGLLRRADYPAAEEALAQLRPASIPRIRWPAMPSIGSARAFTRAADTPRRRRPLPRATSAIRGDRRRPTVC